MSDEHVQYAETIKEGGMSADASSVPSAPVVDVPLVVGDLVRQGSVHAIRTLAGITSVQIGNEHGPWYPVESVERAGQDALPADRA